MSYFGPSIRNGGPIGLGTTIALLSTKQPSPSFLLNFTSGVLDSRVTFTRASTATYYNSTGVLTLAAINEPRFDYNPSTLQPQGLLIEMGRTNLLTYSSAFDNPAWTKGSITITSSSVIAPDGTQSAQVVVPNNGTTVGAATPLYRIVTAATGSYTLSIYAKAKEFVSFVLQDGSGNGGFFNLSTLVSTNIGSGVGSFAPVGNGWYRCVVVLASATNPYFFFYPTTGTGDGVSGIYIWGAQLEAGTFSTSYIPTVAAATPRSQDIASVTTLTPWYNATEGTLLTVATPYSPITNPTSQIPAQLNNGTGAERVQLVRVGVSGINLGQIVASNATIYGGQINNVWALATVGKTALAYKTSANRFAFNGVVDTVNTSLAGVPTITKLTIGQRYDNGTPWNGAIGSIVYYPRRLTDAELVSITAP